ncbi:PKD domain protein [Owenweeksia hongkongensis DSM 17368]|uniref:PKD domain protein n=2 Tax=Owenweeksia TaxID=267986 RepID=G8R432_OWEHD|nr:T9SS type A sorting domain-containing protein [Owenweeksia hongkongensis]AEV33099.1 PKD domain protein [Owenweeksia hongkongensis DSM 17368]
MLSSFAEELKHMQYLRFCLIIIAICAFHPKSFSQGNCEVWEWADSLGVNTGYQLHSIEVDADGNQYVMGDFHGSITLGTSALNAANGRYFIAKRDTNHIWSWAVQLSQKFLAGNDVFDLDINEATNSLMITGSFYDSLYLGPMSLVSGHNWSSLFVAKLDLNTQQWLWAKGVTDSSHVRGSSIITDSTGNIFVAGFDNLASAFSDSLHFGGHSLPLDTSISFVAKLSSSGNWIWVKQIGGGATPPQLAYRKSKMVAAGTFWSANLIQGKYFITALDTSGNTQWKTQSSGGSTGWVRSLKLDQNNNVYLAGDFTGGLQIGTTSLSTSLPNQFVAKVNSAGQWQWATSSDRKVVTSTSSHGLIGVVTNKFGNTYYVGSYKEEIVFGNDTIKASINKPAYLWAKCNSQGTWEWALNLKIHSFSNNTVFSRRILTSDVDGNIYFQGKTRSKARFGFNFIQNPDHFIAKINVSGIPEVNAGVDTLLQCGSRYRLPTYSNMLGEMNIKWTPEVGLSNPDTLNPTFDTKSTRTYYVSVTSSLGCTAMDTINLFVDSASSFGSGIPISTSNGSNFFCQNANFSISAPSYFSDFHWDNGDTTQSIFPKKPGKYILVARDSLGCFEMDSITLAPLADIKSPSFLLCDNDSLPLSINTFGLDSLKWNTGSKSSQIYANQPGKYWVDAYRGACWATDTVEVILFTDTANANFADSIYGLEVHFAPTSIGVNNGYWDFGDGTYLSGVNVSHTYANPGTYPVCFYSKDICGGEGEQCKNVSVTDIGITELKPIEVFSLFPNPANDILNISSARVLAPHIMVFDVSGRILLEKNLSKSNNWQLNIQSLPSGYYFIKVGNQTSKFGKI